MKDLTIGDVIDKYLIGEYSLAQTFSALEAVGMRATAIIIMLETISPTLTLMHRDN